MTDFVAREIAAGKYYTQDIDAPQGAHAGEVFDIAQWLPEQGHYLYELKDGARPPVP